MIGEALKRFLKKSGGTIEGLSGAKIPELGSDVSRVTGWAKGTLAREKGLSAAEDYIKKMGLKGKKQ
jgi:hypothetical protein